ncbi:hypothetical protein [Mucilaginibacter paludis]|uniref:Lipocalin-like domain-containing protein n=1 Tax=Mucilaginibacter paludis DSM 18603 TaxID=714943 RepID=H1XZ41_9SPHI|nr:hypothetical protein [Mucilaginibacter paludis]EHQ24626.1 hypothetical protein Mucpa_0432 [Mucilaginibacter paludis DSM 18603]
MKTILKIILLPISLWTACTSNKTTGFTPGTYVNHAESTYSVADDTLKISADYQITRRTTYHRTNGQPKHLTKHFTGVWDENKQVLTLTQTGTVLLFRPAEKTLLLGNSIYRKIN